MMEAFRYKVDNSGNVIECGYINDGIELTGEEPFSGFDIQYYKKDMLTGEWVFLPGITPVNKEILDVRYDWQLGKAFITIADQFRNGPHEFDCSSTWTEQDCINAINNKFS